MERCYGCDSFVTDTYARVRGNNSNQVEECPSCADETWEPGSAALEAGDSRAESLLEG